MSTATEGLPPAAVIVSHTIADWDEWKRAFDEHESVRKDAGFLGHHINRGEVDPNHVTVYFAVSDVDRAKAFAASNELRSAMEEAGVIGPPEITWVTTVRESIVWDRDLPAVLVTHRVNDFDSWLDGYDDADDLRSERGIVGHAANRSLDDPSVAVIYHQAESFDALRAFLEDRDLQDAMAAAGVASEPDISFHTGGWAKQYA